MSPPEARPGAASTSQQYDGTKGFDLGKRRCTPPGVLVRLAAMVYEAVLLFGVVFGVGFALLATLGWTYPLSDQRTLVLQLVLFVAVGAYFSYCWQADGQTLAMKTWRMRVLDRNGLTLQPTRAVLRFMLCVLLLVVPGLLLVLVFRTHGSIDAVFLGLPWLSAAIAAHRDIDNQWLHDRILGCRVVRDA